MSFLIALMLQWNFAEAQNPKVKMAVVSTYGSQMSQFQIVTMGDEGLIRAALGRGIQRERKLSKDDLKYLLEKYKALPKSSKIPNECMRNRVDIQFDENGKVDTKSSCFGVRTITEPAYVDFMNNLARAVGFY